MWFRMMIMTTVILFLYPTYAFSSTTARDYLDQSSYERTCFRARHLPPEPDRALCSMVQWTSATLYEKDDTAPYFPPLYDGSNITLLQDTEQISFAKEMYSTILAGVSGDRNTNGCRKALERYVCMEVFAECGKAGSVSYIPTCRNQCIQVNIACSSTVLVCSALPTDYCTLYVPLGSFSLDGTTFNQHTFSSYPLMYSVFFPVWGVLFLVFAYMSLIAYPETPFLCKSYAAVILCKTLVQGLALFFWRDCAENGICDTFLAEMAISLQMLYEAVLLLLFCLVANGWKIRRERLTIKEWRNILFIIIAFYIVSNVLFSSRAEMTGVSRISTYFIVYFIMYTIVLNLALKEFSFLHSQYKKLERGMNSAVTGPLIDKYYMYSAAVVLMTVAVLLEFACQLLLYADVYFLYILMLYEIGNMVVLGVLSCVFRPRYFSPFFFMRPSSAHPLSRNRFSHLWGNSDGLVFQHQNRATPIIEVLQMHQQQNPTPEFRAAWSNEYLMNLEGSSIDDESEKHPDPHYDSYSVTRQKKKAYTSVPSAAIDSDDALAVGSHGSNNTHSNSNGSSRGGGEHISMVGVGEELELTPLLHQGNQDDNLYTDSMDDPELYRNNAIADPASQALLVMRTPGDRILVGGRKTRSSSGRSL